jgi:uncharacterized membrane protein
MSKHDSVRDGMIFLALVLVGIGLAGLCHSISKQILGIHDLEQRVEELERYTYDLQTEVGALRGAGEQ